MTELGRFFIRIWAFVGKEIAEVVRQPLLVLTLIVAPFLILLLFGLGYRGENQPLRTIVVMPQDSPFRAELPKITKPLEPVLDVRSVTPNEQAARNELRQHKVDLVVIAPRDPAADIRANRKAPIRFLYNEIDPFKLDSINYGSQAFVTAANSAAAQASVARAQSRAGQSETDLTAARAAVAQLKQAQSSGDQQGQTTARTDLGQQLQVLAASIGGLALLGSGVTPEQLRRDAAALGGNSTPGTTGTTGTTSGNAGGAAPATNLDRLDRDLAQLDSDLRALRQADPVVLTQPFSVALRSTSEVRPSTPDFFAPGVVVLLLQHLGITLAGLSLVRERRMGTMELFRVSPLTPFQTLTGKYISYALFTGVIGALLTVLLVYGLGVPFLGPLLPYIVALLVLLIASLGVGFIISLVARTDSEAVQYAMMMLLTSVFFSGFLLGLDTLAWPIRAVSWLLPATYAIRLLQDIMLRGTGWELKLLALLAAYALVAYVTAWILLRRQFARL